MTWNLYVFTLAGRIQPVVDELLRMQPEIAAIPEMWRLGRVSSTRPAVLALKRDVKGSFKRDIDIDVNIDIDSYFGSLKGVSKSVQVVLMLHNQSWYRL